MNYKLFFLFLESLILVAFFNCIGKSRLINVMPQQTMILYTETQMSMPLTGCFNFKDIKIINDTLSFIERKDHQVIRWSGQIEAADKKNLYQVFKENKFDRIKNKRKKVHNASEYQEYIVLAADSLHVYVIFGGDYLTSDRNRKKFNIVKNAIQDVLIKYRDK